MDNIESKDGTGKGTSSLFSIPSLLGAAIATSIGVAAINSNNLKTNHDPNESEFNITLKTISGYGRI